MAYLYKEIRAREEGRVPDITALVQAWLTATAPGNIVSTTYWAGKGIPDGNSKQPDRWGMAVWTCLYKP